MTFFYVTGLLALLIFWYFLRKQDDDSPPAGRRPATDSDRRVNDTGTHYHAVSIRTGQRTCRAVEELKGERILASRAPRLPLPKCDVASCECSYIHHRDRRTGKDRRSPFGSGGISAITGRYEQERRSGDERRHDDGD